MAPTLGAVLAATLALLLALGATTAPVAAEGDLVELPGDAFETFPPGSSFGQGSGDRLGEGAGDRFAC